jgi:type IV pilus assembly protein PilY1
VACQKNFVILITDGEPTRDDFDTGNSPTNTTFGFADFRTKLIGDYVADGELEELGDGNETAYYLDDIAKFMQTKDFRPDLDGDQLIDVYTVGFTTSPLANSLLQRTAANGNGLFFFSNNPEDLSAHLVSTVADIVQKSQSFSVPTVPTTRTAESSRFYNGYFIPSDRSGWWEGHLRQWTFTAAGEILDANGQCALDDPNAGECLVGPFRTTAVPWWDAGEQVPAPASRNLTTSITTATPGVASEVAFKHTTGGGVLTASHLTVTYPASPLIPGSTATNATQLAAEVVAAVRGCRFGTGANGVTCVPRRWVLG